MRRLKKITRNNVDELDSYIDYEEVNECPICKAKIAPIFIASSLDTKNSASIFNFCGNCKDTFVSKYSISKDARTTPRTYYCRTDSLIYSEPNRFAKQEFDQKISDLSSQFVKIYNQALAAESFELDEIAGLGYRKALEFLIKDFAIHEHPDEEESIKVKPLAQCIRSYISNENITTLAERSAWIGNDEAHYIRKQEDRDVSDMKAFIQAIVYFIGMILITEDAASMSPKK